MKFGRWTLSLQAASTNPLISMLAEIDLTDPF